MRSLSLRQAARCEAAEHPRCRCWCHVAAHARRCTGDLFTEPLPADLGREVVLGNKVILGSVNANRRHFYRAAEALAAGDREWLAGLITRRG